MNLKEKIVTSALALMAAVPVFGQSNSFKEYKAQKEKEFKEYKQQRMQKFQQFKNGRTAEFNDFRSGQQSENEVYTEEAPNISGDHVYYAGVAASTFGLGDKTDCERVNLKDNNRAYIASSPKGVAIIYEGGNGFGATLNNSGTVDYFSVKQERKSDLSAVQDASIIELLNGLNESYGQAEFPQITTKDKVNLAQKKVLKSQKTPASYEHTTAEGVSYSFNEKGVQFSGTLSFVNTDYLMPKVNYDSKNKMYYCGSHRGRIESALNMAVTAGLQRLVMENYIYKDLNRRAQAGETLTSAEKVFQAQHIQRLEKEGIFINKDGKLQQQNPKYPPRQARTNGARYNN